MFAPGYVARMRAEALATLDALERARAAKARTGERESKGSTGANRLGAMS